MINVRERKVLDAQRIYNRREMMERWWGMEEDWQEVGDAKGKLSEDVTLKLRPKKKKKSQSDINGRVFHTIREREDRA